MKIKLIAVGSKMPAWVEAGANEYLKRLPRDFALNVMEIPLSQRSKGTDLARAMAKEGEAMLAAVAKDDHVVALDVKGRAHTTEVWADKIAAIRDDGRNLALLVGGPDGLAPECLSKAHERWSLSALTLPHPLVRIVVSEQLYRVWSILNKHPYHRS